MKQNVVRRPALRIFICQSFEEEYREKPVFSKFRHR